MPNERMFKILIKSFFKNCVGIHIFTDDMLENYKTSEL